MKETLDRVFGTWLRLSKDDEILALLGLVERELRRRGYTVKLEIQTKRA